MKAGVWTIPATRMKAKRKHRVPLSGRAMEILEAARKLGAGSGPLVFPSRGGKPISITKLPRMPQNPKDRGRATWLPVIAQEPGC